MKKSTVNSWIVSIVTFGAMIYSTMENVTWLKTLLCVYFNLISILIGVLLVIGTLVVVHAPKSTNVDAFVKMNESMKRGFIGKCWGWFSRIAIVWFLVMNNFVGTTIMYILCIIVLEIFKFFVGKVAENE